MRTERNIWTYLIVTAVTIVIWFIAASETRATRTLNVQLNYTVVDASSNWIVKPGSPTVRIVVEGSNLALDRAQEAARSGLVVQLPPVRGKNRINLLDLVRRNDKLAETGVTVASIDDPFPEVERDEIINVPARVRASLPGVQTAGEVTIEPAEVTVAMPATTRERIVGDVTVEAVLDRTLLERLPPDVPQVQEAMVRLGEAFLADAANITISPNTVKLGFTIKSRTEQVTLDVVRVHLTGPPEDNLEYIVELEEEVVRNVTVIGDADLIRRISENEVRVFAQLYVLSQEKEQGITSKHISHFVAYLPNGEGIPIEARVENSEVRLSIERKDVP